MQIVWTTSLSAVADPSPLKLQMKCSTVHPVGMEKQNLSLHPLSCVSNSHYGEFMTLIVYICCAATLHAFRKAPRRISSLMNIAMDRVDTMERSSLEVTNRLFSSTSAAAAAAARAAAARTGSGTSDGGSMLLGPSSPPAKGEGGFSVVEHSECQAFSSAAGPAAAAGPVIRAPGLLASEFGTSRRGSRGLVEAAPSDASSDSLMESGSSFSASAFATIPEDTCGVDAAIPDRRSIPLRPSSSKNLLHRSTLGRAASASPVPISPIGGSGASDGDAVPASHAKGTDGPEQSGTEICGGGCPGESRKGSLDADRVTMSRLQLLMDEELLGGAAAGIDLAVPLPVPVIGVQPRQQRDYAASGDLLGAEQRGEVGVPQAPSSCWHEVVCKMTRHPTDGR